MGLVPDLPEAQAAHTWVARRPGLEPCQRQVWHLGGGLGTLVLALLPSLEALPTLGLSFPICPIFRRAIAAKEL